MSEAERAQVFTSEAGDTFVGLVRRVYGVHEHERLCQVAAIVARMTERNAQALKQRIHSALPAGVTLDFPPWSQVAPQLRAFETNREQALAHARKPAAKATPLAAPQARTQKTPGVTEALIAATGERAEVLARALVLLDAEAASLIRTLSPAAAAVQRVGEAIGARLPLPTLTAISGDKLTPALIRFLQTVTPRTVVTEQNAATTIKVLAGGVMLGQLRRLDAACREEFARRQALLKAALEVSAPPLEADVVSQAIAGDEAQVTQHLREHLDDPPSVTPRIRAGIANAWGQPDLAAELSAHGFARFIDTFESTHEDGPLQARLVAAASGGDAQVAALAHALEHLRLVEIGLAGTPSADFAAALPALLRVLRTRRATLDTDESERELAEERRLLAGRNYTSFRKDINAAIDARLTLAVSLDATRKRAVYLALLSTVGHRLSGMNKEQIDAALDKLINTTG